MEKILDKIVVKKEQKPLRTALKVVYYIIVYSLIFWGFKGIEYKGIMQTAESSINALIEGFFNPDLTYAANMTIDGLPYAIVETIAIAISGTFVSAIISIPFALLASQNIVGPKVSKIGKLIVTMIRTFPELILALMFISVVGPGAPAGILALGIHSIGMLGKLFFRIYRKYGYGCKRSTGIMRRQLF